MLDMSATASPSFSDEHRRKRVRKGTRSCWECKRRKIRCQLSSENVSVCSGCLARGTTCLSQEYQEEHDTSSGNQIGERLGRVEMLLETLVSKISVFDEEEKAKKGLHTPESMGPNDVLTPYTSENATSNENAPILSLFDNTAIGRRETTFQSQSTVPSSQSPGTKTSSCRPTKLERLRRTLVDLLPSQEDADLICDESSCWLILHAFHVSKLEVNPENGKAFIPSTVNLREVCEQHPTMIARALLYISICLQQMAPSFDTKRLHLPGSVESRVDRYISTVQTLITSDDELVSTIQGLECLVLVGIFHTNGGHPRRAWLAFRRAMGIAQLMGLHKKNVSVPGGTQMWHRIVHSDRYLALLLGLPCGNVDDVFGPEDTFDNPAADKAFLFARKLSQVCGSISQRNLTDNIQTYAATQEIGERLEQLAKDLPASWWTVPTFCLGDRCPQAADAFERLVMQIWYFQLEALLHLPFMLRPATERKYEYSKFRCLNASREMIYRYLALRQGKVEPLCCKIIDFGALIASVTLLLDLLELPQASESREVVERKESDRALARNVITSMEEMLSVIGGDIIAKQSVNVIKTLLAAESPAGPNGGNLRLTIPYFGTINIARPPLTQNETRSFGSMQARQSALIDQHAGMQDWQGLRVPPQHQAHPPVVSFTSSQFPTQVPEQQVED